MASCLTLVAENAERIPDLELAQKKLMVTLPEYQGDGELRNNLLEIIKKGNMASWYERIYSEVGWDYDAALVTEMKRNNKEYLQMLDEDIEETRIHSSGTEVKDVFLHKAEYLIRIGDKDNAIKALSQAFAQTVALGYKLENVFTCIRIGFFYMDHDLIRKNLERAKEIVDMGVDFDRRNRFKVYQGVYGLITRDFKTATDSFLSLVTTFGGYDLLDFTSFIRYTVISAILTLPRQELKQKIIEGSDMLEALYQTPKVQKYVFSFYECQYADFFESLAEVEQLFRKDYFLHPHYRFYVREMKIKAYSQMLASYKTLTFSYMAEQFGVAKDFIENDLSEMIADGRLYGKIDKANDAIIVTRGALEKKNEMFNNVLRQGDLLLNRVHNLARFVDNSD